MEVEGVGRHEIFIVVLRKDERHRERYDSWNRLVDNSLEIQEHRFRHFAGDATILGTERSRGHDRFEDIDKHAAVLGIGGELGKAERDKVVDKRRHF